MTVAKCITELMGFSLFPYTPYQRPNFCPPPAETDVFHLAPALSGRGHGVCRTFNISGFGPQGNDFGVTGLAHAKTTWRRGSLRHNRCQCIPGRRSVSRAGNQLSQRPAALAAWAPSDNESGQRFRIIRPRSELRAWQYTKQKSPGFSGAGDWRPVARL